MARRIGYAVALALTIAAIISIVWRGVEDLFFKGTHGADSFLIPTTALFLGYPVMKGLAPERP